MEFRLTYEGLLLGASRNSTRANEKHAIRKIFHKQLKRLWEIDPFLSTALYSNRHANPEPSELRISLVDHLSSRYQNFGYRFVPLVTEDIRLRCSISVLFLRPQRPGRALQSGDLDNRIKTLFDALRMPGNREELGTNGQPEDIEDPFYVLMTDDKLITKISVETDWLLEPTSEALSNNENDCRLVIGVSLHPFDPGWDNISFV